MATLPPPPANGYYQQTIYSIREGDREYTGSVLAEGIGPNGLPVWVMAADTLDRVKNRYFITAWEQESGTKRSYLEYRSSAYSLQDYVATMAQADLDTAMNELTKIVNEEGDYEGEGSDFGSNEEEEEEVPEVIPLKYPNEDEGNYSFRDLVDFKDHYGVFVTAAFARPNNASWVTENTVTGLYGGFSFELADGYAVEFELQRFKGNTAQGAEYEKYTQVFTSAEFSGNLTISGSGGDLTLLAVSTPDGSIDPTSGEDTEEIAPERTPTTIEEVAPIATLSNSFIRLLEYPADATAIGFGSNPNQYWVMTYDYGPDWDGGVTGNIPQTKTLTFDTLEEAQDKYNFWLNHAESWLNQTDNEELIGSKEGLKWIADKDGLFSQVLVQAACWRQSGPHWRDASTTILTPAQLAEPYSTSASKYGWESMGTSWSGNYFNTIGSEWADRYKEATTDAERLTVFNEWWAAFTPDRESQDMKGKTFKSLWERHIEVDPDNSIIEGDETGETPFRQFLLEDLDLGVSWVTENMLSVNKSAKRVSIVADSAYGFALRITPPSGMNINMGAWGDLVEDWSEDIGSLVLFFEGGNGITIENGEMIIRHNKAKSVHPFITRLMTSSWDDFGPFDTDGNTYPEWTDNGDRLYFPDDDANQDKSNAFKITLRDGWKADIDLETENMSFFTEHFKKAGEPVTFANDKWSKELSAGDNLEFNQDNEHSGFKDGFNLKTTLSGGSEWTYGTDEAVDDEVWVGFTNILFEKYRSNEPANFEQAIIRGLYPYEFSLDDEAFTIELVQIYDARIEQDKLALEWGTTTPQDSPPEDDDDDDDGPGSNGGSLEGLFVGLGIIVILVLAVRMTGGGLGE